MPRRHDIDALRVIAFALLILYHAAMVYVSEWDFHIKSGYQAEWLQWPMIALNRWRMPLLFMISGIALGLAHAGERRLRFAANRSVRLLLPLLFGMFVVVAPQAYAEGRADGHLAAGWWAFLWRYWQVRPWPPGSFSGWEFGITWNHLWYLAYLLPYTLLLLALAPLLDRAAAAARALPVRLLEAALLLLPIAWLGFVLLRIAPQHPETHALVGDWTVHAESLPLFLLGYALAGAPGFWATIEARRRPLAGVALLAIATELTIRWFGRYPPAQPLPPWLAQLPWAEIERIARAGYTWTALLAIFGWARRYLDRPLRWLPYCSEAVFPWYILHQTLIVLLAWQLGPLRLGPVLEPLLVVAGTVAGCLLLHEYLILRSAWLRPLFGLKPRRSAPMAATIATQQQG